MAGLPNGQHPAFEKVFNEAAARALEAGLIDALDAVSLTKSYSDDEFFHLKRTDRTLVTRYNKAELFKAIACQDGSNDVTLDRTLTNPLKTGIPTWEYKHIRLDYKGLGITQEISILDVDGKRIRGPGSSKEITLPQILEELGNDGWEMVSHAVNQDNKMNGVTFHYYNFKRQK